MSFPGKGTVSAPILWQKGAWPLHSLQNVRGWNSKDKGRQDAGPGAQKEAAAKSLKLNLDREVTEAQLFPEHS